MPINSRQKGARGERQFRDLLRAEGYLQARRGRQFSGGPESPDVVCPELGFIHWEIKAVERLNIEDAMEQARRDCAGASRSGHKKVAVVAHKRKHRRWLVTLDAELFFQFLRAVQPRMNTDEHGFLEPQEGAEGTEILTANHANHANAEDFRRDAEKDPRDAGATDKTTN